MTEYIRMLCYAGIGLGAVGFILLLGYLLMKRKDKEKIDWCDGISPTIKTVKRKKDIGQGK